MKDLPGYEEAKALGYNLNYHGGDRRSAVYTKLGIHLDIKKKDEGLEADLSFIEGLLIVQTLPFSFPNENFEVFETQISQAYKKIHKEVT